MKASIIIPVIRPEKSKRCVDAILQNSGIDNGRIEILTAKDEQGIGCPRMVEILTRLAANDWVMFLGDDTIPQPGFLAAAFAAAETLPDGWGVVGLNTEDPNGSNDRAHWMAHTRMLDLIPGGAFFPTEYRHCFGDDELKDIAQERGRWVFAADARIDHDHPINGGDEDDGYRRAYHRKAQRHDFDTYCRRKHARYQAAGVKKIGLCLPCVGRFFDRDTALSLLRMDMPAGFGGEILTPIDQPYEFPAAIAEVRNRLAERALYAGCSHIAMLDTDQVYPPDTLTRLIGHDVDICGAVVHRRYTPFSPVVYGDITIDDVYSGRLIEADATGTGCLAIKADVFLNLKMPWFWSTIKRPGEDVNFCHKARSNGYRIHIDTSVQVGHLTTLCVDRSMFEFELARRRKEL